MIYFFDENRRYIGCRESKDGEAIPINATRIDPMVGNGEQASWNGTSWVLTDIPTNDQNSEPPAPTLEERVGEVEGKTATLEETLDVLFGGIL